MQTVFACLPPVFLLGLLFSLEDEGFQNVSGLLLDYMA
jgi:hypothetical protein